MKKKPIDLSDIYLHPIENSLTSFIKIVNAGTGLGKTYSCVLSMLRRVKRLQKENIGQQVMGIFVAPQHNQISFPKTLVDKLEGAQTEVFKVRPVAIQSMSDIEKDNNAYDLVVSLFFDRNSHAPNSLYDQMLKVAVAADKETADQHNPTRFEDALVSLKIKKHLVDGIQNSGALSGPSAPSSKKSGSAGTSGEEEKEVSIEAMLIHQEAMERMDAAKSSMQRHLERMASDLVYILQGSYKNPYLREHIPAGLSVHALKKLREASASFYPFMHYQVAGERNVLFGMTYAKLMTKHWVFSPRYVKEHSVLTWSTKVIEIEDLLDGESEFWGNYRTAIEKFDDDPDAVDLNPDFRKLFEAEAHLYLDEADSGKKEIGKAQQKALEDAELMQAIGAAAKENGDVQYDDDHMPLTEALPETDWAAYQYLASDGQDDGVARRVGKDSIRHIQNLIVDHVSRTEWASEDEHIQKSALEISTELNYVGRALLSAPYCCVEAGIDRSVFDVTTAFGGEMFGFVSSRRMNDFVVTATPHSIRITKTEFLKNGEESVPLKSFFLLITINWLIFHVFARNLGGKASDERINARVNERVARLLTATDASSCSNVEELKKFLKSRAGISDMIRVIAMPYRATEYHTQCALPSIYKGVGLLKSRAEGAFSPKNLAALDLTELDSVTGLDTISQEVDIHYAFERAQTIYGMVQVENNDYALALDKSHVRFPLKYRREAAESFVVKLASGQERRVCCFLMSATGGYENSHIPSWSMEAIEEIASARSVEFMTMSPQDYALSAAKQQQRGHDKRIQFEKLTGGADSEFKGMAVGAEKTYRDQNRALAKDGEDEGKFDPVLNQLNTLRNEHKRTELDNLFKGLEHIHLGSEQLSAKGARFGLAIAQTQKNFSLILRLLASGASRTFFGKTGRTYSFENLISETGSGISPGFAIYLMKSQESQPKSRWDQAGKTGDGVNQTLIVCYSAQLDKALTKAFKLPVSNPNAPEYKLKKLLGVNPRETLKEASNPDFNPLDYLLNEDPKGHRSNVLIASAYQSAARGINLIVNKQTVANKSSKRPRKEKIEDLFGENTDGAEIAKPVVLEERDLDALFVAAPPYYSEIRVDVGDVTSLAPKQAQKRFFAKCDRFLYFQEWLARQQKDSADPKITNMDIDLESPVEDPLVSEYFEQQHNISLMSELQQTLGRIERTNANQSQIIFLCEGVGDVIENGVEAITLGHGSQYAKRLVGAMSVVNAKLFDLVLQGELDLSTSEKSNDSLLREQQSERFELLKRESFLQAIHDYRRANSIQAVGETTRLEMEFYEAFRSEILWTQGQGAYEANLRSITQKMKRGMKRHYDQIVDMMFLSYDEPLERYVNLQGRTLDLSTALAAKRYATANPYFAERDGKFVYPSSCFLADMEGNYGEWVVHKALQPFTQSGSSVRILNRNRDEFARSAYEYADFFVQVGQRIVAIDAKHYSARRAYQSFDNNDQKRLAALGAKFSRTVKTLEKLTDSEVLLIVVNTFNNEQGNSFVKSIAEGCYLLSTSGKVDEITSQLGLFIAGGSQ